MRISDWSSVVCSSDLPRTFSQIFCYLAWPWQRRSCPPRLRGLGELFAEALAILGRADTEFSPEMMPQVRDASQAALDSRSEERRGWKECVSTCRSLW